MNFPDMWSAASGSSFSVSRLGLILSQTRESYGKDTAEAFLMTTDNVLQLDGPLGTELQVAIVGSDLVRIVATSFTKRGNFLVSNFQFLPSNF
jgi:hypothetical protein